jgi:hypothetical protein
MHLKTDYDDQICRRSRNQQAYKQRFNEVKTQDMHLTIRAATFINRRCYLRITKESVVFIRLIE